MKVDIFSEFRRIMEQKYELCVLESSIEELKKLQKAKKTKAAAAVALHLIKAKDIKVLPSAGGYADDSLLEYAGKEQFIVATQDKELMKRLKDKDVPVITLRQKKYLVFRP